MTVSMGHRTSGISRCLPHGRKWTEIPIRDPISLTPYGPAADPGCIQKAGHTTVPDRAATDSVLKSDLPARGRPHTPSRLIAPGRQDRTAHGRARRTTPRQPKPPRPSRRPAPCPACNLRAYRLDAGPSTCPERKRVTPCHPYRNESADVGLPRFRGRLVVGVDGV